MAQIFLQDSDEKAPPFNDVKYAGTQRPLSGREEQRAREQQTRLLAHFTKPLLTKNEIDLTEELANVKRLLATAQQNSPNNSPPKNVGSQCSHYCSL